MALTEDQLRDLLATELNAGAYNSVRDLALFLNLDRNQVADALKKMAASDGIMAQFQIKTSAPLIINNIAWVSNWKAANIK